MSIVRRAEQLAVRYLPPAVTAKLRQVRERLPLRLVQSPPVVQMFVNDTRTRSFVGLHNFYSALLADVESHASVELAFYDPSGARIATHRLALPHFAASAVDVAAVLERARVRPPFGVVTAQMTPRWPRRQIYRELGQVAAQFFVFFRDRDAGSVEQTHPLSIVDPNNAPSGPFTSSQVISTAHLDQLVVYQYNPSARGHALEHAIVDLDTGERVASVRHHVPAMGSARSAFRIAELERVPPRLLFTVDALPSANAKPMLRRVFAGGHHSMSHA